MTAAHRVNQGDAPLGMARLLSAKAGVAHNLPVALSNFVGRDQDRNQVIRVLECARLVTLAGCPGVGKTRLALEVGAEVLGAHPDGVWFVELATLTAPDQLPAAIASVLGVDERPGVDVTGTMATALADRRLLLILDNCEHLVEAAAKVAAALLRASAGLVILTTSREPLGIHGECVWRVQPFDVPSAGEACLDALLENSAVRLFAERAARVRPGFSVTAAEAKSVAEICRRLDGVPLAIELAAARMDVLSPHEVVHHLEHRLRLLGARGRREPSTHPTLEATLDWSRERLQPNEALLLGRLTVFAGGWNLEAAQAVCAGGEIAPDEVLMLVDGLVRKSLVTAEVGRPVTRYRLIGIIRDHAGRRLNDLAERTTMSEAHCGYYVALAQRAHAERGEALVRLDAERDNLRTAFEWAMSREQTDAALALAASLVYFWQGRGQMEEGKRWLLQALSGRGGDLPVLRANALYAAALLGSLGGDVTGAIPLAEQIVASAEEQGDVSVAWRAQSLRDLLATLSSPLHALQLLHSTVAMARREGDARFLRSSLEQLGAALVLVGDHQAARSCLDEVMALAGQLGDRSAEAGTLTWLGQAAFVAGDLRTAQKRLTEALLLSRAHGETAGTADALSWLGEVARSRGQLHLASELVGEALTMAREVTLAPVVGRCLCILGHVELSRGDLDDARRLLAEALDIARPIERSYVIARCLLGLGEALLVDGDGAASRAHFEEALALARTAGDRPAIAAALHGLADVAVDASSVERALRLHDEALTLRQRIGDRAGLARSLDALAALAVERALTVEAARIFGAAEALRDAGGYARTAGAAAAAERSIAKLRLSLGEEQLSVACAAGATLSPDDAAAYATRSHERIAKPSKRWTRLTPAEHDIACLAAQGLTSREIAERLFISPRTVGAHLGHVFEKLGIKSRRELRPESLTEATPRRT